MSTITEIAAAYEIHDSGVHAFFGLDLDTDLDAELSQEDAEFYLEAVRVAEEQAVC